MNANNNNNVFTFMFLLVTLYYLWKEQVAFAFTPIAPVPTTTRHYGYGALTTRLQSIPTPVDTLTSGLASILRLPRGVEVEKSKESNDDDWILYDIENNGDCRKVRERLTELDCNVMVVPAVENIFQTNNDDTTTFPPPLKPNAILPQLHITTSKETTTKTLVGASEILKFLNTGNVEDENNEILENIKHILINILRLGRGMTKSRAAAKSNSSSYEPLILYNYEGNQFCRLVREVLCELDLPFICKSVGKKSPRRDELASRRGSTQCPYLIDPNTNTELGESVDIITYLYKTYAIYTPPPMIWQWTSDNIMSLLKPILSAVAPLQAGSLWNEEYITDMQAAKRKVTDTISSHDVVIYTYQLSPFSIETRQLLQRLGIDNFEEVSLGLEWPPLLIFEPTIRAVLQQMTGQSSLPHIFIRGQSIGGLYSGTPGLIPLLERDEGKAFWKLLEEKEEEQKESP